MKSIILAAGMGTRLGQITKDIPKCLLEINNKSLLSYSLDILKEYGINEVIIVIGYKGNRIKDKIGNSYGNMNIKYVDNERFFETGSMYSLSKTEGIIADSVLILESDLIYSRKAIETLLQSSHKDVILASDPLDSGDDVYIRTEQHKLVDLGKKISTDKKDIYGVLVGISKFSHEFMTSLFAKAKNDYSQGKINFHYEECILETSKIGYPVYVELLRNLNWIEIDNSSDYKQAVDKVYPKIKGELNGN